MDYLWIFHMCFVIFFCILPLLPHRFMRIVRWIPLALVTIWFICDGCPLTHIDKNIDDEIFIQVLISPFIKLNRTRTEYLTMIFLFIVTILCNKKYYTKKLY